MNTKNLARVSILKRKFLKGSAHVTFLSAKCRTISATDTSKSSEVIGEVRWVPRVRYPTHHLCIQWLSDHRSTAFLRISAVVPCRESGAPGQVTPFCTCAISTTSPRLYFIPFALLFPPVPPPFHVA